MAVQGFNHLNIRTPDYKGTLDFLQYGLGMKVTPIPGQDSMDKAAWVYDDSGTPVMHLVSAGVRYSPTEVLPVDPPRGTGAIQHVAFTCTDYEKMQSRITALNIEFREKCDATTGIRQIFVVDPSAIMFELYFFAD